MNVESEPMVAASTVDKVRKLLAMAEGASNANEADAFSHKAAEMIVKHRIDPDHLAATSDDDLAVREYHIGRGAYVRARLALLQAIGEAHDCTVVFECLREGTVAYVAGFRTDLELVDVLYESLHTQAASRMASQRRATAAATQQWRRSFLFGFAGEIRHLLAATAQAASDSPAGKNALPALRERRERVGEFAAERFGRVRSARRPKAATIGGYAAGERAARQADLGRQRLGGRQAIERR